MLPSAPGYSSFSSGIMSSRSRFRVMPVSPLVSSSIWPMPFCSRYSSISCREVSSRGRMMFPRTGGMPARPWGPVPRSRFSSTVSAWSAAWWAVAIRSARVSSAARRKVSYRSRRPASSMPTPHSFAFSGTLTRSVTQGMRRSRQKFCTNSSSRRAVSRWPWFMCTAATVKSSLRPSCHR